MVNNSVDHLEISNNQNLVSIWKKGNGCDLYNTKSIIDPKKEEIEIESEVLKTFINANSILFNNADDQLSITYNNCISIYDIKKEKEIVVRIFFYFFFYLNFF
jgi:hypothetical protein